MAEDLASMQVEGLMSITQGMKEEVGVAEAEAFEASASASIESALEAVKAATDGVNNAVLTAQGQAPEPSTDMAMDTGMDMDPEAPAEEPMDDMGDDFEGVDAAADDSDADGREMKEDSYLAALRMVKEAQDNGQINKDVLKKAFAELKK